MFASALMGSSLLGILVVVLVILGIIYLIRRF